MSMPSSFELGRAVGGNISSGLQQARETSAIDQILQQASESGNPEDIQNVMGQILQRVAPERQQVASQILGSKVQELQQKRATQSRNQALQEQGLNPALPESILKEQAKQKFAGSGGKINPEVQKWAYKELEKKAPIQALTNSLQEIKRLNQSDVTGPWVGRVPSGFADKEADAIRKAIDANAIQILNVHKSMFPRGLTQGEFKTLSEKLVSSKNTREANDQIINAYENLAKLQQQKLDAVEQAVSQYGFDPMLPFIVSGIQKQYDEQEASENRKLYNQVMGLESAKEIPNTMAEEVKVTEKTPNQKLSLEEIFQ